ncbi:class I SAM-dependent methyltransferase [Methanococcus maripaludis]|uniref:SAM (And some other nucleotide) binding motif:Generic methyltransferase n=1 Tax=Methanococcus maripaludis (strain DSM 14266 / JCM 13030 / NBRC 101832 / S2 / LL) TaxID=267377 RepID=Q6LY14_METMP|nr:class I SAM-dependent methyltransferase [Methanococcus maripaludis]CAF30735.1 SAM (and some other nucleotide) binding motif:Generic methyltransferase [Methanococcus maripaludis S2]
MSENKKKFDKKGAKNMDEISKTLFAPIYPIIAENIINRFGITAGNCIDIGSGPGALSIALAKQSDFSIRALDFSKHMNEIALKNIADADLNDRIQIVQGDVHNIPIEDNYADLIVSRGSVFFWEDVTTAFREIYRILKSGGKTYIGGGFGNKELRDSISAEMIRKNPDWKEFNRKNISQENVERFQNVLDEIGVSSYEIILEDEGFWIIISKTDQEVI